MSTRAETGLTPAPTETNLREAALRHLARYAATEARLTLILQRRVARWARAAEAAGAPPDEVAETARKARAVATHVVAKLAEAGVVSDEGFAEARVRRLRRGGKSAMAMRAHLLARGVEAPLARAASEGDADSELAGALMVLRRRRAGPFAEIVDPEARRRALAALARAGFTRAVAEAALRTGRDDAEARIARLRE